MDGSEYPVVGAAPAGHPGVFADLKGERHKDFVVLPPLKGPSGAQFTGDYRSWGSSNYAMITKSCKHPEIAVRWLDGFYNDEISMQRRAGALGVNYVEAGPDDKNILGEPAKFVSNYTYGSVTNDFWPGFGPLNQLSMGKMEVDEKLFRAPQDIFAADGLATRLWRASEEYYKHLPAKPICASNIRLPEEQNAKASEISDAIKKYNTDMFAKFVVGGLNIDENWDKYVKQINDLGLDEYIQIIQTQWDKKYKAMK